MSSFTEGDTTVRLFTPRNVLLMITPLCLWGGVELRSAGLLALGAGCVAAIVWSAIDASRLLQSVRVKRRHPERAFEEQTIPVELALRVDGPTALNLITVEDTFPPSLGHKLRALVAETLRPGEEIDLRFDATCHHRRGMYVLGPVNIVAHDPLGFFRREATHDLFSQFVVYPNSVELQEADLLGEGTLRHVGVQTVNRTGYSEEFRGVREYRPGDPMRAIHWRSTARHRQLMVKEFQEQISTRVTMFLDLGRRGLVGLGDQTSVEYGIKAAASVARRAMALGHEIEMFAVSGTVEHVPPGAGMNHLLGILDRLAFLKPGGDSAFEIVARDLSESLPRGSTAVFILGATTVELQHFELILERLTMLRVLPIFILIDDRAFLKVFREQERRHAEAMKLDDLVRELALRGAVVRVIRRAKSIGEALAQGLERDAAVPA